MLTSILSLRLQWQGALWQSSSGAKSPHMPWHTAQQMDTEKPPLK